MGHVRGYVRRDARTGRAVPVAPHRRVSAPAALQAVPAAAGEHQAHANGNPFGGSSHVFEPDPHPEQDPSPQVGEELACGRTVQPEPYDVDEGARGGSKQVGGFVFTGHLEQRRAEMGVSRVRVLQAIVHHDKVHRQQGYSQETHFAVASFPYRLYLSEDRKRVITMVWMTDDPNYKRGTGVPPDCRDAHLATRCGLPGRKGTDGVLEMSR